MPFVSGTQEVLEWVSKQNGVIIAFMELTFWKACLKSTEKGEKKESD